ncbi:host-nuclease inhibitor Gam family protein [Lentibacillus amyloliquefaciens]|uniref:Uncharacterized protein n=1 Tax=Lentibacillus amyloliquefaciens TaxID=1472767 RepID=A0A0U4F9Z6_9BACI|nr:host-nuclease inhibitor Gam family protein [Lentibacillus amyloliquefaciens]ALX50438.1 hypothetical protein AOX59_18745 [Lentibacillus amyloliquefaciens]
MELNEFLDNQEQTNQEGFEITDDQKANWALRKIGQYKDRQSEVNATAEAETEKIEAWANQENDKAQQSIDYFQGLLAKYAMKQRAENPKFKSMKLPNGAIRFRKQQPKFHYSDDQLIDYLKKSERDDLIKVKESPDKSAVKKAFTVNEDKLINTETGEAVDGVEIEHRDETFEVVSE